MRFAIFAFVTALAAVPAAAAEYTAAEAGQHVGETATVVGVLTNVHKTGGKSILWDIGGDYPNNPFTAFVPKKSTGDVPDVTPLVGKTFKITGEIKMYQGKAEIAVTDAKQVQVGQ